MIINSEIEFNGVKANNRVVIQPMEGCDGNEDGSISTLTRRRYLRFAKSGAGIIWVEAVAVCEQARANPRQLWLTKETADSYKKLLTEIRETCLKENGFVPIIIMQATHSGRYSKPYGDPSPIVAYRNEVFEKGKENLPYHIITDEECDEIIEMYGRTAKLASEVGFDGVDVKCCHGYLFNEFLSAFGRQGRYGGSFENRTALYLACIDAVKKNILDNMFITTRLNAYDGFPYPYGFGSDENGDIDLKETKQLISILEKKGIELINITLGNPYLIPSINRPFVGGTEDGMIGVKRAVDLTEELQSAFPNIKVIMSVLTYLGIDSIDVAERHIREGRCKLVGFGRMAFAYPDFYQDYLKYGKLDKDKVCAKCGNCSKMMRAGGVAGCPVKDKELYLPLYRKYVEGKNG